MKSTILAVMAVMLSLNAGAAEKKDSVKSNKPVFTVVKENPITSIKNQNRSDRKSVV